MPTISRLPSGEKSTAETQPVPGVMTSGGGVVAGAGDADDAVAPGRADAPADGVDGDLQHGAWWSAKRRASDRVQRVLAP